MKSAPKWFINRFAERFDVADSTVRAHLGVLWTVQREGRKRLMTDESVLGEEFNDHLTTYGQKLIAGRRRAGKIAKKSRNANQRRAAVVRRKRQKRSRSHA